MLTLLLAWRRSTDLLLLLLSVGVGHQVGGSLLESLISKRIEYWENCNQSLNRAPVRTGAQCRGSFDSFACWPHSSPGNVSVPCPSYLPWIKEGSPRRLHRQCLEGGRWRLMENSSEVWRDDVECLEHHYFRDKEEELWRHNALRLISIIGYSSSLLSLTVATLMIGLFRKLHCTRNYIHLNLFVSFMLRAASVISKEVLLHVMYSNLPTDDLGWNSYSSSATALMCKLSKVFMEYFVACNYFWLLVEAVFLHMLLFSAVLTRRRLLRGYMLLGWGTPVLFVAPWTLVKVLYENTECWSIVNRGFWWIIRGPITVSVLVIFCIFIRILMLLLSKLKADQVKFTDYRYSLARATLVLIPLLGIHEVVFTVLIDECVEGSSRYAKNFINLTLSSFQGFLVAVLYCFANGEVQTEVKKRWQLFLFTDDSEVTSCFHGLLLKHLWRHTRGPRRHAHARGGASPVHIHFLQVTAPGRGRVKTDQVRGGGPTGGSMPPPTLEPLTRKSVSSSDGEMTLGETTEEILEESQF